MRSKNLYKLELVCVKYVPILIALGNFLANILAYFDIDSEILNFIIGSSVATLIPLYISSYAYKFCIYHRMIIHYITINKLMNMYDYYYRFPINDEKLAILYILVAGIFISLIIYYHNQYGERK